MEKITFENEKERNRALGFILGEQIIHFMSDLSFGVSHGTAKRLKDIHRVKLKVEKCKGRYPIY